MKNGMVQTRIVELLEKAGKSLYWLSKESGIAYPTLWRLRDDKTRSIEFRVLEAICGALNCQPGDLLVIVPDAKPGAKK